MADLETLTIDGINFSETSDPSTPASGKLRVYGKTTGLFYITDGGTVVGPLAASSGSLTTIRGRVNADGTEAADTGGFTSAKNSTGNYTVTYGSAFGATPLVIVQAHRTSTDRLGFLIATSTSAFTVLTTDFGGNNADAVFSFIAIAF